jgi:hypothetical protein
MDASPHTKSAEPGQPSQSMTTTPIVNDAKSVGNSQWVNSNEQSRVNFEER